MELFHIIDDGAAVLRLKGGLMKQTKIFRRGESIHAGISGGYLLLRRGNGTINPYISCQGVVGIGVVRVNDVPTWVEPKAKAKAGKLAVVGG